MKKIFIILITIFMLVPTNVYAEISGSDTVKFSKCVDGDTAKFILNGEEITARFLAIDTPETKHPTKGVEPYGPEASEYTCNKLKNAKKIVLEYDSKGGKTDKYGRYLAWIWVDNSLLQKELIEKGLAKVAYIYAKYTYVEELQSVESIAKENKINIWSEDGIETIEELKETKEENVIQKSDTDLNIEQIVDYIVLILFIIITLSQIIVAIRKKKKTNK